MSIVVGSMGICSRKTILRGGTWVAADWTCLRIKLLSGLRELGIVNFNGIQKVWRVPARIQGPTPYSGQDRKPRYEGFEVALGPTCRIFLKGFIRSSFYFNFGLGHVSPGMGSLSVIQVTGDPSWWAWTWSSRLRMMCPLVMIDSRVWSDQPLIVSRLPFSLQNSSRLSGDNPTLVLLCCGGCLTVCLLAFFVLTRQMWRQKFVSSSSTTSGKGGSGTEIPTISSEFKEAFPVNPVLLIQILISGVLVVLIAFMILVVADPYVS